MSGESQSSDVGGDALVFSKPDDDLEADNAIWDDSALIEAYERAIDITYEAVKKADSGAGAESLKGERSTTIKATKQSESSAAGDTKISSNGPTKQKHARQSSQRQRRWRSGELCLAPYGDAEELYEARIVRLHADTAKCTVNYLGYDEQGTVDTELLRTPRWSRSCERRQRERCVKRLLKRHSFDKHHNVPPTRHHILPPTTSSTSSLDRQDNNDAASVGVSKPEIGLFTQSATMKALPMLPPPPPPQLRSAGGGSVDEEEALSSMLMSWYMSGYHTGYYQAVQDLKKKNSDTTS